MPLPSSASPLLAPLSIPMIRKALEQQPFDPTTPSQETSQGTEEGRIWQWNHLRARVVQIRDQLYTTMVEPAIKSDTLTTEWVIEQVSKHTPRRLHPQRTTPLSAETISRWREWGILRYQRRDHPDPDSVTALLTLRLLIQHKERFWIPTPPAQQTFLEEPMWWCWRKDSLSSPAIACPFPLPENLPRSALLFTDWLGAETKGWLRIGNLGCCRWARTRNYHGSQLWDMQEEDFALWGISVGQDYRKALDSDAPLTCDALAMTALLKLTPSLLDVVPSHAFTYV